MSWTFLVFLQLKTFLSSAYLVRSWNYIVRKALSFSLSSIPSNTIAITPKVGEILFDGFSDPIVKVAQSLPFLAGKLPPFDKVGFIYTRNGSTDFDGVFNMFTGKNSVLGKLHSWNYWTQTPYHEGTCGQVAGSHGEFFEINSDKEPIKLFSSDACRVLTLNYVGEKYVDNILGHKYEMHQMLDNGTIYPENKCFCDGECIPSGMFNMSTCKYDSPLFGSLPHYYHADPYYINSVEGIDPTGKDEHELSITIEPTTGIALEALIRLQANMLIQPVPDVQLYENVPKVFFPIFWSEQKIRIPSHEAFKLKLLMKIPIISSATGIFMILMGLMLFSHTLYRRYRTNEQNKYLYHEQNVPLKLAHKTDML